MRTPWAARWCRRCESPCRSVAVAAAHDVGGATPRHHWQRNELIGFTGNMVLWPAADLPPIAPGARTFVVDQADIDAPQEALGLCTREGQGTAPRRRAYQAREIGHHEGACFRTPRPPGALHHLGPRPILQGRESLDQRGGPAGHRPIRVLARQARPARGLEEGAVGVGGSYNTSSITTCVALVDSGAAIVRVAIASNVISGSEKE